MTDSCPFRLLGIALGTALVGLFGCSGPLTNHGTIYMGRAVHVQRTTDGNHLQGIPVKEARSYVVKQYVIEGTCTPTDTTGCRVIETDIGRMVLAAPNSFLEIQYRGNLFVPAELAVEINNNSTLRTLSVQDSGKDHSLYFHFGDHGTGMR